MAKSSKKKTLPDVADLTKAQAKTEHMRLALELEGHDKRYYQDDAPSVTDAEYDSLRARFNAIEKRFPEFVSAESPSQKVGAAPSGRFQEGAPRAYRCCRWTTPSRRRTSPTSSAASSAS